MLSVMAACNNDSITNQNENTTDEAVTTASLVQRGCASEEIRQEALKRSPELQQRFAALETNTEKFANDVKFGKVLADGTVEIPVIVNVIYKTTAENVSNARIAEQIAVLNADYSGTNTDASKIPTEFQTVRSGNTKVKFRLVNTVRKSTSKTSWATNDGMKKSI